MNLEKPELFGEFLTLEPPFEITAPWVNCYPKSHPFRLRSSDFLFILPIGMYDLENGTVPQWLHELLHMIS